MKNCRVLVISDSPLFVEAVSHLLKNEESIELAVQTNDLAEARSMLKDDTINVVIIDHDATQLRDVEVLAHLINGNDSYRVIFLTMAGNEMIVHQRERIKNVTPADLVKSICIRQPMPVSRQ